MNERMCWAWEEDDEARMRQAEVEFDALNLPPLPAGWSFTERQMYDYAIEARKDVQSEADRKYQALRNAVLDAGYSVAWRGDTAELIPTRRAA